MGVLERRYNPPMQSWHCGTVWVGGTFEPEEEYYSCEYCGSLLRHEEMKCQNCGAPRVAKKRWLT